MTSIRKAVFPVAGFGTRFLPATKAMPKELLPIVDNPLIQYAAEEAIAAGIDTLIFVTGRNKRAIEDHFDNNQELEAALRAKSFAHFCTKIVIILPKRGTFWHNIPNGPPPQQKKFGNFLRIFKITAFGPVASKK
jgi:UTP--glucose-1-phosphate uridylyltransferase